VPVADPHLVARLRAGGIVAPSTTIAEAARSGLPLALACALLEKESGGGRNVFGQDPTIFVRAGEVTRAKYQEYKRQRDAGASKRMQGVGPCQLTWWEFQDAADREGGCWRPELNMRIGFRHLLALVAAHGEADGARRYNGSGDAAVAYSRDLLAKRRAWEQRLAGLPVAGAVRAGPPLLRRGDEGALVRRLTRRLSYVRSRATGDPFLDGSRARLDAEAELALKAFQREYGLDDDGVFGMETMRALRRAIEREKARDVPAGAPREPREPAPGINPRAGLPALVGEARRADHRNDRALYELILHGRRLRRRLALEHARMARGAGPQPAGEIAAILLRIESKLETLVRARGGEPAVVVAAAAGSADLAMAAAGPADLAAGAAGPADAPGATATDILVANATVTPVATPPPPLPEGPRPPGPVGASGSPGPSRSRGNGAVAEPAPEVPAGAALAELSDQQIARRINQLDQAIDEARGVLVERFESYERELAALQPARKRRPPERRPAPARRPPARGTRAPSQPSAPGQRPPSRGTVVDVRPGAQGHLVRGSKIALSRFLSAKGSQEHAKLRRALRREARLPKRGALATPQWEQAVRAAQHLAGRPVSGVMDGELERILQPYWPRDSITRRIVRSTPAWRAIPGQVSPNFNLREFGCKDGTPYVAGLVREQGVSKTQAKARGRELAKRLERVRKADGDRRLTVTSAFRTRAHNAKQPGAVPNSSHLRGFAVDVTPPPGVSLSSHHKHMRAAFERGVGYYPAGRGYFVHGDFDPAFARRDW